MEWVVVFSVAVFLIGIILIVRDATTFFEPPKKQPQRRES
jgi:hypothetical protein